MLIRQNMVLDTLRRVQTFLDRNDGLLGAINKSGARRTLDAIVAIGRMWLILKPSRCARSRDTSALPVTNPAS